MSLKSLKDRLLSNESFKKQFETRDETELAVRVGAQVQELRARIGVTQTQLAELIQTQQPNIARIEAGKKLPSLSTLHKIASSVGMYLSEPHFQPIENKIKIEDFKAVTTIVTFNHREFQPLVYDLWQVRACKRTDSDSLASRTESTEIFPTPSNLNINVGISV